MKPLSISFIFICHLSFLSVSAQTLPEILTTRVYKAGVYKTFSEFLQNEPSITDNFQVISLSGERKIEKGVGNFKLIMLDSAYTRRDSKKFWGVSDGESIFVNELMYGSVFNFKRLQGLGRYCYLKTSPPYNYNPALGGLGAALTMALEPDVAYLLNVNNGKFYLLDKHLLSVILKSDNELLARYETEKGNGNVDTMLSYIEEYNARHSDEASTDTLISIEIVLYRRNKKEMEQSFTVRVNDGPGIEMKPDSYYKLDSFSDTVNLCVNDRCEKISLAKKRINYVHCSWRTNARAPELEKVEPKVGEFYLKEIEFNHSRK